MTDYEKYIQMETSLCTNVNACAPAKTQETKGLVTKFCVHYIHCKHLYVYIVTTQISHPNTREKNDESTI